MTHRSSQYSDEIIPDFNYNESSNTGQATFELSVSLEGSPLSYPDSSILKVDIVKNDDPDGLYELTSTYDYSWYGSLGDQPYTEIFPLSDEVYPGESFSFLYANSETLLFDKLRLVVDYEDGLRNLERLPQ